MKKKLRKRNQKLLYYGKDDNKKTSKWRKIPYLGNISIKIARLLEKNDIRPAFYCTKNLGTYIINSKDKADKNQKNGIYKLKCEECSAVYVGQTGRCFKKRITEHFTRPESAFNRHLLEEKHQTSKENFDILHIVDKGRKMDRLEMLEIKRVLDDHNVETLNEQIFVNTPLLDPRNKCKQTQQA